LGDILNPTLDGEFSYPTSVLGLNTIVGLFVELALLNDSVGANPNLFELAKPASFHHVSDGIVSDADILADILEYVIIVSFASAFVDAESAVVCAVAAAVEAALA
jgi:hypothetical protein